MKKKLVPIAVIAAVALAGGAFEAASSLAAGPPSVSVKPVDWGQRGHRGHRGHRREGMERIARVLNLTQEQKTQIRDALKAERPTMKPIFQELREARRELRKATQGKTFDEAAVKAAAAKQAQAQTDLMVARARLHNRILALLTPEQRALWDNLRPLLRRRPRPGGVF